MKHLLTKKLNRMLAAIVISSTFTSCVSYSTIQLAQGEYNVVTGKEPKKAIPASYILLPGSIAADIVTSPFQLYLFSQMGSTN